MDIWHIVLAGVILVLLVAVSFLVCKDATLLGALGSLIRLFRPNILILSGFVFVIIILLVVSLFTLINGDSKDDFLKGALIGLIGTGITALTALGNNILEKDSKRDD